MVITKNNIKMTFIVIILILGLILSFSSLSQAVEQPDLPELELPVFITSSGQTPDYNVVNVMATRIGLDVTVNALAEPEDISGYKTLISVLGGSGKGLGAAGIDVEDELGRIDRLKEAAREQDIFILGMHIGGMERRGPTSEHFVPFADECDYLIVRKAGDEDGFFAEISEENDIPLYYIEMNAEIGDILNQIFDVSENANDNNED